MTEAQKTEGPGEVIAAGPRKAPEITPISQSAAIIQVIERAALNPEVDIDKMERLLQMQERVMDREGKMAFNAAMAAAQAEMEPVARDARNAQTSSNYARIEAIAKAIKPVTSRHGFALSFGTADCPKDDYYRITCDVTHANGHVRSYHADVPVDLTGLKGTQNKTRTHAFGSTMTYGRRYLTLLIFDIATADDDGNAAGAGETITADQYTALRAKIEEAGADEAKLCRFFKIPNLEELPQARYGSADAMLDAKIAKGRVDG